MAALFGMHKFGLNGDDEAAADLVQDAWMAVVQNLHRLSDPSAFPAWVYRIVTNKCNDWQRRRRTERSALDACAAPPPACAVPDAAERLAAALAGLTPEDRALVTLYYFDELTVTHLSEIFGIPAGTVKSRLHRCRTLLRRHLEEHSHE